MIHFDNKTHTMDIWCDGCNNAEHLDLGYYAEFTDYIEELRKRYGWLVTRKLDEWKHYCPGCRSEIRTETDNHRNPTGTKLFIGFLLLLM